MNRVKNSSLADANDILMDQRLTDFHLLKGGLAAFLLFLSAAFTFLNAQTIGEFNWENLGIADEAAIPQGVTMMSSCGGFEATLTWSVDQNGGMVPFSGSDFVTYETTSEITGEVGDVIMGFDNNEQDQEDQITLTVTFDPPICDATFAVADVDLQDLGWVDQVEIYIDGVNLRTMPANYTLSGICTEEIEIPEPGFVGICSSNPFNPIGNVLVDMSCDNCISQIDIVYYSGLLDITTNDPQGQRVNLGDIDFDKDCNLPMEMPCIELIKSSALNLGADMAVSVGDVITYTYDVTNCGDVPLTNVTVTEDATVFTGSGPLPVPSAVMPATLAVGESGIAMATYVITQLDIDAGVVTNQALASGVSPAMETVEDISDSGNPADEMGTDEDPTDEPIPNDPCIELIKSSSLDLGADMEATPGDLITYLYEITNCGPVALNNVMVTEDPALFTGTGPIPTPTAVCTLAPGGGCSFTVTYALTADDILAGVVTNQAIATGMTDDGGDVMDVSDSGNMADEMGTDEDPTNEPIPEIGCISLIKSSSLDVGADGIATPGDLITYTYVATNCGNVDLNNLNLIETVTSFTGTGGLPVPSPFVPAVIAANGVATASATYAITQEDIDAGMVSNQALATGDTPGGDMVMDDSDSGNPLDEMGTDEDPTVEPVLQVPCIELIKSSSLDMGADGISSAGDVITYDYDVTNCGNVTLTNVIITEIGMLFTGTGPLPLPTMVTPMDLVPGESGVATASYSITQDDIDAGSITNQAEAVGMDPNNMPVTDISDSGNPADEMGTDEDPTEEPIPNAPCIELMKMSAIDLGPEGYATPGDIITYMYLVTNCGNSALLDVDITENAAFFTGTGALPVPEPATLAMLEAGNEAIFTATYEITADDILAGQVANEATAGGETTLGEEVEATDDVIEEIPPIPCLGLACNNQINLSLDHDCEALITPDMITEGVPDALSYLYTVQVLDQAGNPIPGNLITIDYLGQTLTVSVIYDNITNPDCSVNSCWGTIVVEDKIDPTIECECPPGAWVTDLDCQYSCLEVGSLISGQIGDPDVDDNCDQADAVFTGFSISDGLECGEYIVTQNWTMYVADEYGNYTNSGIGCVSEYYVFTADIGLVDLPDAEVIISCENAGPNSFDPDNTGYPELAGDELGGSGNGNGYCNLVAYYSDLELEACSGTAGSGLVCDDFGKVIRTWTVLDWCNAETTNFTQVIKILDIEAPVISATDIIVSVDPWECAADILLGPDYAEHITIEDNCSSGLSWFITGSNSGGIINGNSILNVPKGNWVVTIGSVDCCGNVGYYDINVSVIDATPPIPVAHQDLIVGLTSAGGNGTNNSGKAKIFKENIDNGSFDMCSNVHLEIRRDTDNCGVTGNASYSNLVPQGCSDFHRNNDHDYGGFVSFCCQDLNVDGDGDGEADGMIKVWLRVWDDANMDGMYGSYEFVDGKCELLDNFNETWVYVTVEDKSPSYIVCPPDITIPCDWDHTDLSITGEATGTSTCGTVQVEYSDWGDIECGSGVITREWTIVGEDGYQCNQTITVTSEGNQDVNVQCANNNEVIVDCDDYEIPDPWYGGGACNLVGISSTVDTFFFEEDACYKVIKEWTIIDWCTGDEYFCNFTLAMIDTDAPEIMCQDTCVAVDDYWDADNDGNYCELANDIMISNGGATDEGACPSEWIKWTIQIDYFNDGDYDAEYSSFLPHNSSFYVAPTQMGTDVTVRLNKNAASSEWAYHAIKWIAFDGCGNFSHCVQTIEIADKKAPTPYCIGISTALMSPEAGNLVELWAKDFNIGSFDNCTSPEDLLYTFDGVAPVLDRLDQVHYFDASGLRNASAYEGGYPVQKWNPADNSSATKFIGLDWCGMNDIQISVWDEKFNSDYCTVELLISGVECPEDPGVPRADLLGQITTEEGETVEAVIVENNSNQAGYPRLESTPVDGSYAFSANLMYQDYSLRPTKDNGHINGVSTLDLVLIQRHVLGISALESGYKLIAADINNNQEVAATDLVELRRLILGIYSQLPENSSWRFVNSNLTLDATNPWPFTETREIISLDLDMMTEDFVGVKIGDVNGSVVANTGFNSPDVDSRSNKSVGLILNRVGDLIEFKAGEDYNDIYGYQFTIAGGSDLSNVIKGALNVTEENFGVLNDGSITVSYANEYGQSIEAGSVLFTLDVKGDLSLNKNGYVSAEAYQGSDFETINLEFRTNDTGNDLTFALAQNEPNPFNAETTINFTVGQTAEVNMSVYDLNGKVLYEVTDTYEAGDHNLILNKDILSQHTGVLYYQMESDSFTATRKMIRIK